MPRASYQVNSLSKPPRPASPARRSASAAWVTNASSKTWTAVQTLARTIAPTPSPAALRKGGTSYSGAPYVYRTGGGTAGDVGPVGGAYGSYIIEAPLQGVRGNTRTLAARDRHDSP
jgi:hypothetical protein